MCLPLNSKVSILNFISDVKNLSIHSILYIRFGEEILVCDITANCYMEPQLSKIQII